MARKRVPASLSDARPDAFGWGVVLACVCVCVCVCVDAALDKGNLQGDDAVIHARPDMGGGGEAWMLGGLMGSRRCIICKSATFRLATTHF